MVPNPRSRLLERHRHHVGEVRGVEGVLVTVPCLEGPGLTRHHRLNWVDRNVGEGNVQRENSGGSGVADLATCIETTKSTAQAVTTLTSRRNEGSSLCRSNKEVAKVIEGHARRRERQVIVSNNVASGSPQDRGKTRGVGQGRITVSRSTVRREAKGTYVNRVVRPVARIVLVMMCR